MIKRYLTLTIFLGITILPLAAADPEGFVLWPKGSQPAGAAGRPIFGNHLMSVVHRNKDLGAEAHVRQSEIWVVQSGEATLVVGGELVDPKPDPPENIHAASIRDGVTKHISAGDIVHIQAGTPHHLIPEPGKDITYFAIKITIQ